MSVVGAYVVYQLVECLLTQCESTKAWSLDHISVSQTTGMYTSQKQATVTLPYSIRLALGYRTVLEYYDWTPTRLAYCSYDTVAILRQQLLQTTEYPLVQYSSQSTRRLDNRSYQPDWYGLYQSTVVYRYHSLVYSKTWEHVMTGPGFVSVRTSTGLTGMVGAYSYSNKVVRQLPKKVLLLIVLLDK